MQAIMARLGLDAKGFKDGLKNAENSVGQFSGGVGTNFKRLGGLIAGGAVMAGITSLTRNFLNFSSNITDTSEAIGVGVENLQRWEYAASQGGAGADDFKKGMVRLNQQIDAARNGNEAVLKTFEDLGVRFKDLETKSPEDIFLMIADGTKNAKTPTDGLTDAIDLLGKSGVKLAPMLKQGADAIREIGQQAHVVSSQVIADAERSEQMAENFLKNARARTVNFVAGAGQKAGEFLYGNEFEQEQLHRAMGGGKTLDEKIAEQERERLSRPTPGGGRSRSSSTLADMQSARQSKELTELLEARAKAAERLMSTDEKIVSLEGQLKDIEEDSKDLQGDALHKSNLEYIGLQNELNVLRKQKSESAEQLRIQQASKAEEEARLQTEKNRLKAMEESERNINKLLKMARRMDKQEEERRDKIAKDAEDSMKTTRERRAERDAERDAERSQRQAEARAKDAADRKGRGATASETERSLAEAEREKRIREKSVADKQPSRTAPTKAHPQDSKQHGDPTAGGKTPTQSQSDMMTVLKNIETHTKTVADKYGTSIGKA